MPRSYHQHCSLAHALDIVGERWTLLIVRELLVAPRRYSDLADGLVTVPSNMLADRLKDMEARGLVERRNLPAPAASIVVYDLTEWGRELAAAVTELARWGLRTLPATKDDRPFHADWLVLGLQARFTPEQAAGLTETYEFRVDRDDVVRFEIRDGDGQAHVGAAAEAAVRIGADADTLIALTSGAISAAEAIERGARIEGRPAALARMRRILPARRMETHPGQAIGVTT